MSDLRLGISEIFQVQKYRIDEVYDSKLKAKNWDLLIEEFHAMTEKRVAITKPQIIRFERRPS